MSRAIVSAFVVLGLAGGLAAQLPAEPSAPEATTVTTPFRGHDGEPLPFPNEAALLAFLRSAPVVDAQQTDVGVTRPLRVVLRHGEIEVRGVFHTVDIRKNIGTIAGRPMPYFVDSYRSQIAAYELDRLMGLHRVPPTVERRVRGHAGSLQLWIEGGTDLEGARERGLAAADPVRWSRQLADVWVFDTLIRNTDRNQGNFLFDADGRLWWIDHTRAFGKGKELMAIERVERCSRHLWEALRDLDRKEVDEALSDQLTIFEIKALMKRRDGLVEHLEGLIAERGEPVVIFGEPVE